MPKRFSRDIGVDYDIKSFFQDGTPKYIKVKSTKQDMPTEFYLSKKEIAAANKMVEAGERYFIYRIYNINLRTLSASLIIYEWPFDDTYYNIEPEYWSIKANL